MVNPLLFREYDIRGIVGVDLTQESVKLIGYYLGGKVDGNKIVAIGYDARTHSPQLRDYLTSGLRAAGCIVLDMGMVATPVNYFSNYQRIKDLDPDDPDRLLPENLLEARPDASIMITGSHNPPEYNGFKITIDRAPFFGDAIYALRDMILADNDREIAEDTKRVTIDLKPVYIDYMIEAFSHLRGLKQRIVIDCGNGVAGTVLPAILDRLSLDRLKPTLPMSKLPSKRRGISRLLMMVMQIGLLY